MKQIIKFNILFIIFFYQFLIAQNQDSTAIEKTLKKYKLKAKDLEINVKKPDFFYIGCRNLIDCNFINYKMSKKYSFIVSATKCIVSPHSIFFGSFDLNPMSNITNVKIGIIHKDEIKYKGEIIELLTYNTPCKNPPNPKINFYINDIIFTEFIKDSLPIDYIRIVLWPDSIFDDEKKSCYPENLRRYHYLDGYYKMSNIQVYIDNEMIKVINETEKSGNNIHFLTLDISKFKLKIGQELKIVVGDVFRLNSLGNKIPEKIPIENRTFVLKL